MSRRANNTSKVSLDSSSLSEVIAWGEVLGLAIFLVYIIFKLESMCLVTWLCLTLCNPVDCSPPGSSVYGISQARILEWVAIFFSWSRDQTCIYSVFCSAGRFCTHWGTGEACVRPVKSGFTLGAVLWKLSSSLRSSIFVCSFRFKSLSSTNPRSVYGSIIIPWSWGTAQGQGEWRWVKKQSR